MPASAVGPLFPSWGPAVGDVPSSVGSPFSCELDFKIIDIFNELDFSVDFQKSLVKLYLYYYCLPTILHLVLCWGSTIDITNLLDTQVLFSSTLPCR